VTGDGQVSIDPWACLWRVHREHGKSVPAQLLELARLGIGGEGISPVEYYRQRLYDDARYSWEEKRRFLTDTRPEIGERVANPRWAALTDDKLLAAALLGHHGIATPRLRAVFHPTRGFPGARSLRTAEALADYLRDPDLYPLFVKPVGGSKSRGSSFLEGWDTAGDRLLRRGEAPVAVEDFARALEATQRGAAEGFHRGRNALGHLLQDVVRQDPRIVAHAGETVSAVRACTGIDRTGAQLFEVVWKIAAPDSPADNFARPGAVLAALDPKTGEIVRAVRGAGPDEEELERNPHTGEPLLGFRLPHYEALVDVLLRGSTLYPEVRLLAWDVAIGPDGPVVLEVNRVGTFALVQLATGRGLGTDAFRAFVRRAEAENPGRPRGWKRLHRTRQHLRRLGKLVGIDTRRRRG
jgi:hypothetical protein